MGASVTSFTLPNGLTVIHKHRPGSACVALSLRVIAGSQYELPSEIGAAHFLEHIVMDGTENYPDEKAIAGLIEERGGFRNAFTNRETVEYVVKLLKEDATVGFEYLSEIVRRPLVNTDAVAKQKKIIEQEILRFKNSPASFAPRLLYAAMYPGTRMGALNTGEIADVQRLSRDILVEYHWRTHVAGNMALAVCGDISLEETLELAKRHFGTMRSGERIAPLVFPAEPAKEPLREQRPDAKQSVIAIGFPAFAADNPHQYAAHLLMHVLCTGSASRLNYEIREKRGLAYSVSANHDAGRTGGLLSIHAGVAEENVSECLDIIRKEVKNIITNPLSAEERNKALSFVKAGRAFRFEDSLPEASNLSWQWCMTGKVQTDEMEMYAKVAANAGAIQQTAKRLFAHEPAIALITAK